jgi:hypothetical protein
MWLLAHAKRKEERKMSEMQGIMLAMPTDERKMCCARASGKSRQHSSPGRLSWYFVQRSMPGLVYVPTMNGYVASSSHETKGGKENV